MAAHRAGLVSASRWPDQPIFYPVLNRWYASKIAREWNTPAEGIEVKRSYLDRRPARLPAARDAFIWLNPPGEMLDRQDAWGDSTTAHPRIAIIGGSGAREQLVVACARTRRRC